MNGINVCIYFLKNNLQVNANFSAQLTMTENLKNLVKMLDNESLLSDDVMPVVFSKFDDCFIDPSFEISKLNVYPGCKFFVY